MQVIGEEDGYRPKLAGGQKSSWKSTTMRAGLKGRGIVGLCNSRWKKNWGVLLDSWELTLLRGGACGLGVGPSDWCDGRAGEVVQMALELGRDEKRDPMEIKRLEKSPKR
jgi:hypothetical protein